MKGEVCMSYTHFTSPCLLGEVGEVQVKCEICTSPLWSLPSTKPLGPLDMRVISDHEVPIFDPTRHIFLGSAIVEVEFFRDIST